MIGETLILQLPHRPIAVRIRWGDGTLAVRNRICRIGNVFAISSLAFLRCERKRAVLMKVKVSRLRALRWPRIISVPGVGTGLEGLRFSFERFALAMQPIAEPRRLDLLAIFNRGRVFAEGEQPEGRTFTAVPPAVDPWSRDHDVVVVRVAHL